MMLVLSRGVVQKPGQGDQGTGRRLREAPPKLENAEDLMHDAAAQVAMLLLESLLVDEQKALEGLRESSIEDRALGMA